MGSALRAACAAIALLLAGCAGQQQLREAELAELAAWLPGHYDNQVQAAREREQGTVVHEPVTLAIAPIYAPFIGDYVFYAQEMAADDPRRVYSQKLMSFAIVDKERIVQSDYRLAEPERWRNGHISPDLFKGLMAPDVQPAGCPLVWEKDETAFTATNEQARCRIYSRSAGGMVDIELRAELTPAELALARIARDPAGRVVEGSAADPFYRFRRTGGP